jgi:trigger factor
VSPQQETLHAPQLPRGGAWRVTPRDVWRLPLKVTVDRTAETEAALTVELDWSELEKASDRAFKKLVGKYNVPGFRPGKAPRSILERMVGKETIYQEGLEELIDSAYHEAVHENALVPVGQPELEAPPIEIGQPYTFVARVPVLAPVVLGDYKAIRVQQTPVEVTDEEIDATLERMRESAALWLPADRSAQVDDRVTVDLKLTVGEKVVSDLHDNEFELAIERPGVFAGMDDHLIGLREGEKAEFTTTIPEDYTNSDLAGKEARYEVDVKAVKYRELPELDDEFAKTQGAYEHLDALRDAIRKETLTRKEADARRDLREQVLNETTEGAKIEVHQALVEDEKDAMIRETTQMLAQSRLNFEQYLQIMNKSLEEYRAEIDPEAKARVKRDLALNAVADAEEIEVSDEEIQNWLDVFTAVGGKPMQLRTLSHGQLDNVTSRIRRDKALARLVEIATQEPDTAAQTQENAKAAAASAELADAVSAPEAPKAKPKRAKKEVPAASDQPADE